MYSLSVAQLTHDQVRHIAKLARLRLSDAEVEKFSTELTAILQYVDMLQEVNTEGVPPTEQVTGLSNALRDDVPLQGTLGSDLLACSPLPIVDNHIETPSAHG